MCTMCTLKGIGVIPEDLPPNTPVLLMLEPMDMAVIQFKLAEYEANRRGLEIPKEQPADDHPMARVMYHLGNTIKPESILTQPLSILREHVRLAFDMFFGPFGPSLN